MAKKLLWYTAVTRVDNLAGAIIEPGERVQTDADTAAPLVAVSALVLSGVQAAEEPATELTPPDVQTGG